MRCFGKWRHKWRAASKEEAKQIRDTSLIIGIHVQKVDICSKCSRVRIVAWIGIERKPKTKILPPYPFEKKT